MTYITTNDGTQIFYKDWGRKDAQPIVFHHGWPLSADDWDNQMMFFLAEGYRVIAHDRRGHGRSSQTDHGNEMDTYASDVAQLVGALDLRGAIHIGHSTGGGEVAHYVARAEPGRVSKAVLIDAVPPVMVRKDTNPGGTPIEVFDGYRAALAANRAQLYLDIPTGPFYGFNRPGAKISEGLIRNWWRQAMMGSIKAGYECIKAFSETDFTADLNAIEGSRPGIEARRPGFDVGDVFEAASQRGQQLRLLSRRAEEYPRFVHATLSPLGVYAREVRGARSGAGPA